MFLPLFFVFSISSSVLWPCVFFLWKGRIRKIHKTLSKEVAVRTTPPTGQACSRALLALQCPHHVDRRECTLRRLAWLMRALHIWPGTFLPWAFSTNPSVLSVSYPPQGCIPGLPLIYLRSTHTHVYPKLPFLHPDKTQRFLFVSLKSTAGQ